MGFGRILLRAAMALCVLITAWGHAAQPDTPVIELKQAPFKGLGPEKMVNLPHLLEPGELISKSQDK